MKHTAFFPYDPQSIDQLRKILNIEIDLIKTGKGKSLYKTDAWKDELSSIIGNPIIPLYSINSTLNISEKTKKVSVFEIDQVNGFWKVKYIFSDGTYLYEDQIPSQNS